MWGCTLIPPPQDWCPCLWRAISRYFPVPTLSHWILPSHFIFPQRESSKLFRRKVISSAQNLPFPSRTWFWTSMMGRGNEWLQRQVSFLIFFLPSWYENTADIKTKPVYTHKRCPVNKMRNNNYKNYCLQTLNQPLPAYSQTLTCHFLFILAHFLSVSISFYHLK